MKIAVRYKRDKEGFEPQTVIVPTEHDLEACTEDTVNDWCHDYISDMLGEDPKWIRVEGKVTIEELKYKKP